jgi:hypothetical protein
MTPRPRVLRLRAIRDIPAGLEHTHRLGACVGGVTDTLAPINVVFQTTDGIRNRHECTAPPTQVERRERRVRPHQLVLSRLILPQVHLRKPCYDLYFL